MSDRALLLMGHGSRDTKGIEDLRSFAEMVGSLRPQVPSKLGIIEFAEPSLDASIEDLIDSGAKNISLVPVLLLGAGHQKDDGPVAIFKAKEKYKDITFSYGRPLGNHRSVFEVLIENMTSSKIYDHLETELGVLNVGRGSTDVDANSDLFKATRVLEEMLDRKIRMESAFISLTTPSVYDGLEKLYKLGARKVLVVCYFLFRGVLPDRVILQSEEFANAHGIEIDVVQPFGLDNRIAGAIWERYDEIDEGQRLMNCDLCQYRFELFNTYHR